MIQDSEVIRFRSSSPVRVKRRFSIVLDKLSVFFLLVLNETLFGIHYTGHIIVQDQITDMKLIGLHCT